MNCEVLDMVDKLLFHPNERNLNRSSTELGEAKKWYSGVTGFYSIRSGCW